MSWQSLQLFMITFFLLNAIVILYLDQIYRCGCYLFVPNGAFCGLLNVLLYDAFIYLHLYDGLFIFIFIYLFTCLYSFYGHLYYSTFLYHLYLIFPFLYFLFPFLFPFYFAFSSSHRHYTKSD